MGTWSAPNTRAKKKLLRQLKKKLTSLEMALYPLFGDDLLFDYLAQASDRINEALVATWDQGDSGFMDEMGTKRSKFRLAKTACLDLNIDVDVDAVLGGK